MIESLGWYPQGEPGERRFWGGWPRIGEPRRKVADSAPPADRGDCDLDDVEQGGRDGRD